MTEPTNRTPTCVVCGEVIDESAGEVPVFMDPDLTDEYPYDGTAYHLQECEGDVFSEVYAEVSE